MNPENKKKPNNKMRLKEIMVLFHSLDIEKKEFRNIQKKMEVILFVREQLSRMGLETENIERLLDRIEREKQFSQETIQMLNTLIPEKVDSKQLQVSVKQFLQMEDMSFHELARALGIPDTEVEVFIRTGYADSYLTMKIFEYFQCHDESNVDKNQAGAGSVTDFTLSIL